MAPRARVLVGLVAASLLVGCASSAPVSGAPEPVPRPAPEVGQSTARAEPSPSGAATHLAPDAPSDSARDEGAGRDPYSAAEVPVAPETSIDSLSHLLGAMDTSPLLTAPLPGPARAHGRLVRAFPGLLLPTRASRVQSSSISPSGGDRLQVGLVGSSSLSAAQVLLAYRTRLARRGLAEQVAPVAAAGAQAAAFRRGRSVVTVTVALQGSRTTYSVHASLHTGGA